MLAACARRDAFMERQFNRAGGVARYYRAQGKTRMGAFYHRLLQGPV
jgi:hypothetical protein